MQKAAVLTETLGTRNSILNNVSDIGVDTNFKRWRLMKKKKMQVFEKKRN